MVLKLYWALGFNGDGNGYHVAARQLAGPVDGGVGEQTGESLTAPAPVCVCSNELLPWLGRLRCWYPHCVFVTLAKKASLLIVSHGALSSQYSQPFLSLALILPLSQP